METVTVRIALFKSMSYEGIRFYREEQNSKYNAPDEVRISEYVDVEFPLIGADVKAASIAALEAKRDTIQTQIVAIEQKIEDVRAGRL